MNMYVLYHIEKEKLCGKEVMDEEQADTMNRKLIEEGDSYRWLLVEDDEDDEE